MSNTLINESSPYLLQHAHNPVNWYPWGTAALQKAIEEDKPILVSIGYSACHWCHVMERESFEDEATAAIMNEHFVNIKIDREERPDLDHIYMDALQAMEGGGGWPLNVFLTPSKKPFYGGTYFPPKPVANRPSWKEVLIAIANAFKNDREKIEEQANGLTEHLSNANKFGINTATHINYTIEQIDTACQNTLQQADTDWGGFGKAPKFPQAFSIQFLLKYYHYQKNLLKDFASKEKDNSSKNIGEAALQQALLSLDKMIDGGIYDQIGGGFARYSTDAEWMVPHFEKMLYDNALLITTLSEAFQITQNEKYKDTISQTLSFLEREMLHSSGGFYSALDADSEGIEGKFYVWDYTAINNILNEYAPIYCQYYNITEEGNWDGSNIPQVLKPITIFAEEHSINETVLKQLLNHCNQLLLEERSKRIRPALDDKIIFGWNALINIAYCKAYAATGNEHYKAIAISNMNFLLSHFVDEKNTFYHVWKNDQAKFNAFLDDMAYLIQALLQLHRITENLDYLHSAKTCCENVIAEFSASDGYFYFTPLHQQDVIVRKKELYDGATPSGNAVMAQNLLELSILLDLPEWLARSHKMIAGLENIIIKYPTSFGVWLDTYYQLTKGTKEIVLLGNYKSALKELLLQFVPHSIVMASQNGNDFFPLLKDKKSEKPLAIFLCENYSCKRPVYSIEELLTLLT